jgi:HTH-type transcriptional repressor of NAD biosynthesis genes
MAKKMAGSKGTITSRSMKHGLILGKFMPLHNGHLSLIAFAKKNCQEVTILLCTEETEPIPSGIRLAWLEKMFETEEDVHVIHFPYDKRVLPNTSRSSKEVSKIWATAIKPVIPQVDCIISSEQYGDYVASELGISHLVFDIQRFTIAVSGNHIREKPFSYWAFIPPIVRPFFVKKIVLVGTESTGKSTLAHQLAEYFETTYVHEVARDIVAHTNEVTYDHLIQIAHHHAEAIVKGLAIANKLLFIDTDLTITESYSRFLFGRELNVNSFTREINKMDLYLFLTPDCPLVQDGTRLEQEQRLSLSESHKTSFEQNGIALLYISGDWTERFEKAKLHIQSLIDQY